MNPIFGMSKVFSTSRESADRRSLYRQLITRWMLLALLLGLSGFATAAPSLLVSSFPDRSSPTSVSGANLSGQTYIFVTNESGVVQVDFYLDAPPPAVPRQTERKIPYDFNGTAPDLSAYPYDTNSLNDGQHSVYARVTYSTGVTALLSATFTVNNSAPKFEFSKNSLAFQAVEGATASQSTNVAIDTVSGTTADFSISDNANWLSISPTSGTTPATLSITVSPAGLAPGSYNAVIEATGDNIAKGLLSVSFEITPANTNNFPILVSTSANRSSPSSLQGADVAGLIYVFVPTSPDIRRVTFYLNDTSKVRPPFQTENKTPYDMAGTDPADLAKPFDTTALSDGQNTVTAVVLTADNSTHETNVFFNVINEFESLSFAQQSLAGSRHIDNTDPVQQVVNLTSSAGNAEFSLSSDAPWLSAVANSSTTPAEVTVFASPNGLAVGTYTGTVTADAEGYTAAELTFTLTITDDPDTIVATPNNLIFRGAPGETIAPQSVDISHSMSEVHSFSVSTNMPWLSASPASGQTPASVQVSVDSSGIAAGNYAATLTITAAGFPNVDIPVTLALSSSDSCAPVVCTDVRVTLPYQLTFTESQGHLADKNGFGTGFTWIDKPTSGSGYLPQNLEMRFLAGVLELTTTSGIQYLSSNNLDNALGVGFAAPNQVTKISTQILDIPAGTSNYEQAGLWFGNDEDNYIKVVTLSHPQGPRINYLMELNGQNVLDKKVNVGALSGRDITFTMLVNPYTRTVEISYRLDGGTDIKLDTLSPPDEFFSFDAAGIDPEIGTRSFTGIFATHRNATTPLVYRFDEFTLEVGSSSETPETSVDFLRKSYSVPYPTSMVWGPDDKLYVAQLFGSIEVLEFDDAFNVISQQTITSLQNDLGPRLTLGITISPQSTAQNVELWLAHSSPSVDNGEVNSGMVSRLSGPNFGTVDHVITGLPRAQANHSVNSLHFGPDNRLYIAVGGNTGAGAPNNSNSEFGTREEQPLSAAIVVADVFAAGFDGTCNNAADIFGPPPCDVVTYATGLRNSYDFAFHSNGKIYATDNGLGVTGTYPPRPEPQCLGFGNTASYLNGGQNPGTQPDLLHLIKQGQYYGHPNPHRDECVFKSGSYQNVAPLPNYEPPLYNLGEHKSSNGIIEYNAGAGCVGDALNGQLLITNYSVGDDIVRVRLSESGNSVVESEPLITGFNDPLPLTQNPAGVLFVGQFGGDQLTSLQPVSLGCWQNLRAAPVDRLDASAAAVGASMYVVGGKNSSGHQNTLLIYNTGNDSWSQGASLPGVGVENPAVVAYNGQVFVFGGSTAPFSGSVRNAAVYTPSTNSWTSLPDMPTERGGARAEVVNGKIYVVGGLDSSGQSLASVDVFSPSTGTWSTAPAMGTRRDNPGTAVIEGKLYAFGGRTRNADGSSPNPTLQSMEMFNPATNSWTSRTSMPTGRRAMAVGYLNGRFQVMGGEQESSSPTGVFTQNEEYNPATNTWRAITDMELPKHGAASATINNTIYVFGGGLFTGSSYSATLQAFRF